MTPSLLWKEYRTQRMIWLLLAFFALAALYSLIVVLGARANLESGVGWLAAAASLAFPTVYGLVCGSLMLAGEREDRTLWLLDYHAGGRLGVWANKLVAGIIFTACYSLVVALVTMNLGLKPGQDSPRLWLWLLPLVGVEAFLWGLLGSAFSRSGVMAILKGALVLALPWFLTLPDQWSPRSEIVLTRAVLALAALAASGLIFCRNDWQRSPRWASPVLIRLFQPRWWAIPWLVVRQGAQAILVLAAASLFVGCWVPYHRIALWPIVTLILGVVCGTAVFSGENAGGARYLGDRRIPGRRVWLVKTLIWMALALGLAAFVVVGAWFRYGWEALQRSHSTYFDPAYAWRIALGLNDDLVGTPYPHGFSGHWCVFELAWLLTGFAVGQFCSIIFRKSAIAAIVAMLSSGAVAALLVPSFIDRELNIGWVLGFAGFLLAGNFLVVHAWTAGRLGMKRPVAVLAGSGLLAVLCIAGHMAYRAFALPDVGEPFDVHALENVLNSRYIVVGGQRMRIASQPGERLRTAVEEIVQHEKSVTRLLGTPAAPLRLKDSRMIPADYRSQLAEVLRDGWPNKSVDLERWLKETLQVSWVNNLQQTARSTPEVLQSASRLSLYDPAGPTLKIQQVLQLFQARALLEQDRRAHGAVLDDCETLLGVSRHLRHYGNSAQTTASLEMDQFSFGLLEKWLEALGPQQPLLQQALKMLNAHERGLGSVADTVKVDYVMARNTFQSWEVPRTSYRSELQNNLIVASRMAPWEKEYIRRLLNIVFERELAWVNRPYWQSPPAPKVALPDFDLSWQGRFHDLLPGFYPARFDHRPLYEQATNVLCRLRGLRLQVALALYQVQEKKPAAKLGDLVPRYLAEVPIDPYSGKPFGYRISRGEQVRTVSSSQPVRVRAGQGIVWSTGPDQVHGEHHRPTHFLDDNGVAIPPGDMVFLVPLWPKQ